MAAKRVVVVTGGGSGIGKATAAMFAAQNDKVYVLGRDRKRLEVVASTSENISAMGCDITNLQSVQQAVEAIGKQHKAIDVLVNCAGGTTSLDPDATIEEAKAAWDFVIDLNLGGVFNVTSTFLPLLKRPGSRIIYVTSLAALGGSSQAGATGQAYSAAKAGVHGMSRTLAKALAPEGITVNCVAPGVIDHTEFFGQNGIPADRKAKNESLIPEGRLGEPEEIAAGILYLASEKAGFVTGEILNINGGAVFGR